MNTKELSILNLRYICSAFATDFFTILEYCFLKVLLPLTGLAKTDKGLSRFVIQLKGLHRKSILFVLRYR